MDGERKSRLSELPDKKNSFLVELFHATVPPELRPPELNAKVSKAVSTDDKHPCVVYCRPLAL
jgi:hypothetical protein